MDAALVIFLSHSDARFTLKRFLITIILLQRIGEIVNFIFPPHWDINAAFNVWEHKWVFLTVEKGNLITPGIRKPGVGFRM